MVITIYFLDDALSIQYSIWMNAMWMFDEYEEVVDKSISNSIQLENLWGDFSNSF